MTDGHDNGNKQHDHGHEHHDHGHDDHAHGHEGHVHQHHHSISYEDAVAQFRADKDTAFKSHPDSPIPDDERESFDGLSYYPVDTSLAFDDLRLDPYTGDEPTSFQIPTSDGRLRPAVRAGVLHFSLEGADHTLTAYTFEAGASESLFVPFLDATSGTETYGAGRYLDLEPDEESTYSLDFNLAYHPSCLYDEKYSCPLTPAENRLPVPIRAGERLPPGSA